MHILQIVSQHRRDFKAIYECEHCKYIQNGDGYDDKNFHDNIIPNMECPECNKKAGASYVPAQTKFPEGVQI